MVKKAAKKAVKKARKNPRISRAGGKADIRNWGLPNYEDKLEVFDKLIRDLATEAIDTGIDQAIVQGDIEVWLTVDAAHLGIKFNPVFPLEVCVELPFGREYEGPRLKFDFEEAVMNALQSYRHDERDEPTRKRFFAMAQRLQGLASRIEDFLG